MRRKLLLGNWKMNKTVTEAKEFASAAAPLLELAKAHHVDIGIAPSFVALEAARKILPRYSVKKLCQRALARISRKHIDAQSRREQKFLDFAA